MADRDVHKLSTFPDQEARGVGPAHSTTRRVAGSVAVLAIQYGATTILTAITTIAVTRLLEPTNYGVYGSAVAAWTLLGATADLGTTSVLSRDLGDDRSSYRPRLMSAYTISGAWSLILANVLVGMAFASGISHPRSQAILALAPSMIFNGLNPAMSVFYAAYETKRLLRINVASYVVQGLVSVSLAATGHGPVAVAAGVSVTSAITSVAMALSAHRLLLPSRTGASPETPFTLLKLSVPLSVLGILTRVYGTLDLVLLGWYVSGPRLGDYAAASKILTVFAGLAGQVMAGALPGLAAGIREGRESREVAVLTTRICHWLLVSAMPMFLAIALFPSLIVRLALGSRYAGSAGLIEILAGYGTLAVGTNLAGNLLVAARRMRPLYVQSVLAIAVNVGANLVFIPLYGVYASAWITVATEAFVCGCAFYSARALISFRAIARVAWGPVLAASCAVIPGAIVARDSEAGGAGTFVVVLALGLFASRSWPEELPGPRFLSPRRPPKVKPPGIKLHKPKSDGQS
jgi:O-antigen/teichoic acid export membrane protein